jgi:uncharacterized protein
VKIAIVGSGIAGLTAAHHLRRDHDITVYEAGAHPGGHTHTVDVDDDGKALAIDTGFIVFNDWTYPNFIALLDELGVASQPSNMSFSLRCERTGLEYNGTSLDSLFAQRRNLVNPSFLRMIADILRFNGRARRMLATLDPATTLGELIAHDGYGEAFRDRYLVPMGRAIWSASEAALLGFPARFFIDFFHRHGFLSIDDRPQWRAIRGGSREYVRKLTAPFAERIRLRTPVTGLARLPHEVRVRTAQGVETFDYVFLACHSDEALALLSDADAREREILGALPYERNEVVLHTDESLLPRRPRARAAWNYHLLAREQRGVAVTYCMNTLQSLDTPRRYLVTLNNTEAIDPRRILERIECSHPVYTPRGVAAQARREEINGPRRTFFCGAYWSCGFHEDGVLSALRAVEDFRNALIVRAAA